MKKVLALWLFVGCFAASVAINIYHARGASQPVAPSVEPVTADDQGREAARSGPRPALPKCSQPRCIKVELLGLTPAQKQQFADCCPNYSKRCGQLCQQMAKLAAQLEAEISTERPNRQRIYRLADQLGQLHAEELRNRINTILLVRDTLTADQLDKLVGYCSQQ